MKLSLTHNQIALLIALCLSALGIAAQTDAQWLELHELHRKSFLEDGRMHWRGSLSLWGPYALAWMLGLGGWYLIGQRRWLNIRGFWPWFALALAIIVLPLTWHQLIEGTRLYYPAEWASHLHDDFTWPAHVPSLVAAIPFLAFAVAALNQRLVSSGNPPGLRTVIGFALGVTVLVLLALPFVPPIWLLLLPLAIALAAPGLKKAGFASLALLIVLLAIALFSSPYRFLRFMKSVFPDPWSDPLGSSYQFVHAYKLMFEAGWFGSQASLHLPAAMSQYLPVSIAVQWGWLAFAGVLVLIAIWLMLTWPKSTTQGDCEFQCTENYRFVAARMIWFVLFFAALDACLINTLLIQPHGSGMPLLTGNWGWILLAGILMGLNSQRQVHLDATSLTSQSNWDSPKAD